MARAGLSQDLCLERVKTVFVFDQTHAFFSLADTNTDIFTFLNGVGFLKKIKKHNISQE